MVEDRIQKPDTGLIAGHSLNLSDTVISRHKVILGKINGNVIVLS